MPSHPPCALSSLTTRIEGSRTSTLVGWATAGSRPPRKSADDTPGCNDFLALAGFRPVHEGRPKPAYRLGRTLPEDRLRRSPFGILFKMPTTTTGLSRNENEPARREPCRPVRGNRSRESRDRPQPREKLADAEATVKHPAKPRPVGPDSRFSSRV